VEPNPAVAISGKRPRTSGRFLVWTMKITKPTRKKIGWLVASGAVAGMLLGNFSISSALVGVLSDLGAMSVLAVGMVLIVM
jgi:hypothetical protein